MICTNPFSTRCTLFYRSCTHIFTARQLAGHRVQSEIEVDLTSCCSPVSVARESCSRAAMPAVLVSGAANGLGAAFVDAYRSRTDARILAVDLEASRARATNVQGFVVDVTSASSVSTFAEQIKEAPIDLFIHCAGIRGLVPAVEKESPNDVAACETMDAMDTSTLARAFQINAVGTFTLIRAVLANLRTAKAAKVVVMSSRMGSIENNEKPNKDAGSAYAYRASKAAMNTIVRSFAVDVPEVTFVLCHPGRVETKLVRCKEEGAISPEESVAALLPLIERWNMNDSGRFYDRFGKTIPW